MADALDTHEADAVLDVGVSRGYGGCDLPAKQGFIGAMSELMNIRVESSLGMILDGLTN
jgi:hypothetical protein